MDSDGITGRILMAHIEHLVDLLQTRRGLLKGRSRLSLRLLKGGRLKMMI